MAKLREIYIYKEKPSSISWLERLVFLLWRALLWQVEDLSGPKVFLFPDGCISTDVCITAATQLSLIPSCSCCCSWVRLVSGPNPSMDYVKRHVCRNCLIMKILRVNREQPL